MFKEARDVIKNSKCLAKNDTVSSVCPQVGRDHVERTDGLNAGLPAICTELDVFVNNDSIFYLNNGSVNEGFLYEDGKILNRPGINKLCKNLKLPLKQDIKDLTKRPNPPQMPLQKSFP